MSNFTQFLWFLHWIKKIRLRRKKSFQAFFLMNLGKVLKFIFLKFLMNIELYDIIEIVSHNAYDLKYISDADINYNPALGTGQIQIKDIHYVSYQYRTTWEMCQTLDKKYLHSSRRTIEDFYREAKNNKWIKED